MLASIEFFRNYVMEYGTVKSLLPTCTVLYALTKILMYLVRWGLHWTQIFEFEGPPLPFLGHTHLFIGSGEVILSKVRELMKLHPLPIPIWLGRNLTYFISTPEQLKIVCQSDKTIDRGPFIAFTKPLLGEGLFTAPPAKWRLHRNLITPSFHLKILQSYVKVFAAESAATCVEMEQHLNGLEFAILDYTSEYVINAACETVMGVNLRAYTDGRHYRESLERAMACVSRRIFSPWLHPDFMFHRSQIIQTKKNDILECSGRPNVTANENDECNPKARRQSFLDHLLTIQREGKALSDQDIRGEVHTMVVGAFDGAAMTISNAMLMLASHPEVQVQYDSTIGIVHELRKVVFEEFSPPPPEEKVYQELCGIYGDIDVKEQRVTPMDLSRMQYLERVINETMRLFPPTPLLVRAVDADLDIGGVTLPKQSTAVMGIIGVHRNEKYWPDPLKFDPDRFLPEEVAKRHPFAYIPFSGGIRNCIGSKYAMMLMKTFPSTVLRRYVLWKDDIEPVEKIRLKFEMLLRTVEPIKLRIQRRAREDVSV